MSTDAFIRVRPAAVAGMFYPGTPSQLSSDINRYLNDASTSASTRLPRALIVPHAGYIYSGAIAASAYHLLESEVQKINQVILLGPSHHLAFNGIATPDADYFATPLGNIRINQAFCHKALTLDFVQALSTAHQREHSLEVQLPFLQTVLADFELTPLVVGNCGPEAVSRLLKLLWDTGDGDSDGTLVIISTDLSHFHDYETAKKLDEQTSQAILQLQPEKISAHNACGKAPLNGLLTLAKERQLRIECLDLRNSGDTASDRTRVVGYGAYAIY
ncbi:MAG TPA: AmmeMemoRadiSam system protein B [Gammaproteobacteria bacterium]|nr:AmmeMemoRadiSam system protein B [Gammaproteobacteria bacterium]